MVRTNRLVLILIALLVGPPAFATDAFTVCKCREGNELWLWDPQEVADLCKRRCPVNMEHDYTVNPATREVFCHVPGLPHGVHYRTQIDLDIVALDGTVIYTPTGLTPYTVNRTYLHSDQTGAFVSGGVSRTVPFQCHSDITLSEQYVAFRSGADRSHHLFVGISAEGFVPLRPVIYAGRNHEVEAHPAGPRIYFGDAGELALQYCFDGTRWTSSRIVRMDKVEETEIYAFSNYTCGEDAVVYYSGVLVRHDPPR